MGFTRDPTIEELHPPGGHRILIESDPDDEEDSQAEDFENATEKFRHKFIPLNNIRAGNMRVRKILSHMDKVAIDQVVDVQKSKKKGPKSPMRP